MGLFATEEVEWMDSKTQREQPADDDMGLFATEVVDWMDSKNPSAPESSSPPTAISVPKVAETKKSASSSTDADRQAGRPSAR